MGMYLGNQPVRVIKRSDNQLFNINGEFRSNQLGTNQAYVDGNKLYSNRISDGASLYATFEKEYEAGTYTISASVEVESDNPQSHQYRIFTNVENSKGVYNS